jgi:hypothetical protein
MGMMANLVLPVLLAQSDQPAQKVNGDVLAKMVVMENQVNWVQLDHRDLVANKAKEDIKEKKADADKPACPEQRVPRVQQDHKESEDTMVRRVNVAKQESRVLLDLWVRWVRRDPWAKPDTKARTEKMANPVFREAEVL